MRIDAHGRLRARTRTGLTDLSGVPLGLSAEEARASTAARAAPLAGPDRPLDSTIGRVAAAAALLDADPTLQARSGGANDHPASAREVELVGSDPLRRRPAARAARRTRVEAHRQVPAPEEDPSRSRALLPLASHSPDARGDRALARQGLLRRARA